MLQPPNSKVTISTAFFANISFAPASTSSGPFDVQLQQMNALNLMSIAVVDQRVDLDRFRLLDCNSMMIEAAFAKGGQT